MTIRYTPGPDSQGVIWPKVGRLAFLLQMGIGQLFVRKLHIMRPALKCTFQPENVVCTHKQDSSIKIIDFGLAKHLGPDDKVR
jgi:hypothetical protein